MSRQSSTGTSDWLLGAVKQNPEGLLLLAAGACLLLRKTGGKALFADPSVACPRCGSTDTTKISEFGSTACKAQWRCAACAEPFDYFKCI